MAVNVRTFGLALAILLFGWPSWASAQVNTVERAVKAQPGKAAHVGLYLSVQPDCSSGPLPTIRLISPPEHGKIVVKKAKVSATNYKQCLALEVPGLIAVYQSLPNYLGIDVLTLEVKYHGGKTEIQRIKVNVGTSSPGQGT